MMPKSVSGFRGNIMLNLMNPITFMLMNPITFMTSDRFNPKSS